VIGAHGCDRYRSRVRSYDWARVCYDDLAGYLGVAVGEALKTRGFMILEAEGAQLTRRGMSFLAELGIKFDMLSKEPACILPAMLGLERAPLSRRRPSRRDFSQFLFGAAVG
jgi:hypothetical protein